MKRVILCDMDQVIAHTDVLQIMNDFLGTSFTINEAKTVKLVEELIPDIEERYRFIDHFVDMNFYKYSEIRPGTKEVLKTLSEKEDLYICTNAVFKYGRNREADLLRIKSEFLVNEFGFIPPDHRIYITHKHLLHAEIRIDDAISYLLPEADIKLLYTAYDNEDIAQSYLDENKITRVADWYDIESIILG